MWGKKVTRENSDEFVGLPKKVTEKMARKGKRKGNIKVTKKGDKKVTKKR